MDGYGTTLTGREQFDYIFFLFEFLFNCFIFRRRHVGWERMLVSVAILRPNILPICIEDKKLTHEKGIDFRHKPQDIEYKALNLPLLPFFFYWVIVFFL